jgi:hypothetical protein
MRQNFVEFYSPGSFVAEVSERPIKSWNVASAKRMAKRIKERHGATPYGFRFVTRGRGARDLDSKIIKRSPLYYLGGKVETLAEVKARATEKEKILVSNMECNNIKRIITNNNSWKFTGELHDDDVVLSWP